MHAKTLYNYPAYKVNIQDTAAIVQLFWTSCIHITIVTGGSRPMRFPLQDPQLVHIKNGRDLRRNQDCSGRLAACVRKFFVRGLRGTESREDDFVVTEDKL